jgi:hypothetical protein
MAESERSPVACKYLLNFLYLDGNATGRRRFEKSLPRIISAKADGSEMYAFWRVQQGYQWGSFNPIEPVA